MCCFVALLLHFLHCIYSICTKSRTQSTNAAETCRVFVRLNEPSTTRTHSSELYTYFKHPAATTRICVLQAPVRILLNKYFPTSRTDGCDDKNALHVCVFTPVGICRSTGAAEECVTLQDHLRSGFRVYIFALCVVFACMYVCDVNRETGG